MAILRSVDGKFYEVPDDQLDKFLVPEDKVKEKLAEAGGPAPEGGAGGPGPMGPPPMPAGTPTILVQIFGAVPGGGAGLPGPGAAPCPPGQQPARPRGRPARWPRMAGAMVAGAMVAGAMAGGITGKTTGKIAPAAAATIKAGPAIGTAGQLSRPSTCKDGLESHAAPKPGSDCSPSRHEWPGGKPASTPALSSQGTVMWSSQLTCRPPARTMVPHRVS